MPNIKSAKKRVKVIATKSAINQANRSALKTQIKKANIAVETNAEDMQAEVQKRLRRLTRLLPRDSCTRIPLLGESPPLQGRLISSAHNLPAKQNYLESNMA